MGIDTVIMALIYLFLILGALDRIFESPFGLGVEFEKGLVTAGKMFLPMTGMMVLAPLIGTYLSPVLSPFFVNVLGADPSMFVGCFLGSDCGGAPLAEALALDPQAGLFNGLIVASMLAPTLAFTIPVALCSVHPHQKTAVIYGIVAGLVTIPIGALLGGLAAGFEMDMLMANLIPITGFSTFLLVAILIFREKLTPIFVFLGRFFIGIAIVGLCLGASEAMIGVTLVEGLAPIDEAFVVIGHIGVILAGAFPLLYAVHKVGARFFTRLAKLLRINETSVLGFLACLPNSMATFGMMKKMDARGLAMNAAFCVSAGFVLGDHLAFTAQYNSEMVIPLLIAKSSAGVLAVLLTLPMLRVLMPQETGPSDSQEEEIPLETTP